MASRAPRPCRQAGCGQLSRDGSGYCEAHKQASIGWNRERRGSAHSRGYGAKWRKLRDMVLRRDKYLCVPCGKYGFLTPATEVDHIVNKAQGGTDNPENLQGICTDCHKAKTKAEARHQKWGGGESIL